MLKRLLPIALLASIVMILGCPGQPCGPDKIYDCAVDCVDESEKDNAVGDGICDDNFNCSAFNFDGGDCEGIITTTTTTSEPTPNSSEWAKFYIEDGELLSSFQQTTDGGYIMYGNNIFYRPDGMSQDYMDSVIIKLDSSTNIEWQKTFSGSNKEDPDWYTVSSFQQTTDGGYIMVGDISSPAFYSHAWIVKLDSSGNVVWQKMYGGTFDHASSGLKLLNVQQATDGGCIFLGFYESTLLILKLDNSGNIEWQKGYIDLASMSLIQQTTDGGYIVTYDTIDLEVGLAKLDSSGNIEWQKIYGRSNDDRYYEALAIQQTSDGGYIMTGWAPLLNLNFYDGPDAWIVKLDSSGNIEWQKMYGGNNDQIYDWYLSSAIQQTSDGGYILGGGEGDYYNAHHWVLKLDNSGNAVWQKTYYELAKSQEILYTIHQTTDGGYIIGGVHYHGNYGTLILKTDSSGNIPGCDIVGAGKATALPIDLILRNGSIDIVKKLDLNIVNTNVSPQNFNVKIEVLCEGK